MLTYLTLEWSGSNNQTIIARYIPSMFRLKFDNILNNSGIYILLFYVSMLCFKTRDTFCVDETIYLNIIDNDITLLATHFSPLVSVLIVHKTNPLSQGILRLVYKPPSKDGTGIPLCQCKATKPMFRVLIIGVLCNYGMPLRIPWR